MEAVFPFLSEVTKIFLQNRVQIFNSRVLAGGFVIGRARVLVLSIYKKVVEKTAV